MDDSKVRLKFDCRVQHRDRNQGRVRRRRKVANQVEIAGLERARPVQGKVKGAKNRKSLEEKVGPARKKVKRAGSQKERVGQVPKEARKVKSQRNDPSLKTCHLWMESTIQE
jgi:hypothetical protein